MNDIFYIGLFLLGSVNALRILPNLPAEWKYGRSRRFAMIGRSTHSSRGYIYDSVAYLGFSVASIGLWMHSRPLIFVAGAVLVFGLIPRFILWGWNPRWLSPPWARGELGYLEERQKRRHTSVPKGPLGES